MSRPTWTRRSRRCCRRAPSWRRIRRRFWPRSTSRTSCSRRGRVSARSPPGSPRSRTTWRSCFPPGSARRSSGSCRRVSLRLPRGAVLEIDPMTDVLRIVAGLLVGGIAAGVAFYALGRRVERRMADAAARAAAAESERLLADARQRVVLAAREELMQARETFEQEAARRRRESERREQLVEQRLAGLRSEEHTSELQSQSNIVCRLLLEKKKTTSERTQSTSYSRSKSHSRGPARCSGSMRFRHASRCNTVCMASPLLRRCDCPTPVSLLR